MKKIILLLTVLIISCAPVTTPEPVEGVVSDKRFRDAWVETEYFYFGCSYDFADGENKCGYKFHSIPKTTHHPAEYEVAITKGEQGKWIYVSKCLYDILDVNEFYSEKENYGCE